MTGHDMTDYSDLTPINIVTGFLGSGKTTLLSSSMSSARSDSTIIS